MKSQYRAMVDTRRLYSLEFKMCKNAQFSVLTRQYSHKYLSNLIQHIWKIENVPISPPTLLFDGGMRRGTNLYSWYYQDVICLAPGQHDLITTIHEIVHAMGYQNHDLLFLEMYIYLLSKYTILTEPQLMEQFQPIIQ